MAIKYYPNRVFKGKVPAIDRVMAKRKVQVASGIANAAAAALDVVVSSNDDWQTDTIQFKFSDATPRDFYAYIKNGRKIVANLNDYLWIHTSGAGPQKVTLDAGFYSGTQLAAHLKAKLDAFPQFVTSGEAPFTVSYVAATGLFTITPTAGTIRYIDVNTSMVLPLRDSIAGHLFGLTTTANLGGSIITDTPVYGLDTEVAVISQPGSVALSYLRDTVDTLSVDQAIHLTSNSGPAITVDYVVTYEEII